MYPAFANSAAQLRNRFALAERPKEVRKINPNPSGKCVPTPHTGIYIQDFELAAPRISLELYLHKTSESQCGEQALCRLYNLRLVNRFNVRAELTKILGVLPLASRNHRGQWKTVFTQRRIRDLLFATPGHDFLHNQVLRSKQSTCFVEPCHQRFTIFGKPYLWNRKTAWFQTDRRLENHREWAVDPSESASRRGIRGPRLVNPESLGELMEQALVTSPAQFFPRWHCQPIPSPQLFVIAGYYGNGVVVRGEKHPSAELMTCTKIQKEVDFFTIVAIGPWHRAASIAGGSCHEMTALFDNPNRDSATAQASHHPESSIIRSHNDGTAETGGVPLVVCRAFDQVRSCRCGRQDSLRTTVRSHSSHDPAGNRV